MVFVFVLKVMIAVQENATGNFSYSVKRALMSVGAGMEEVVALEVHTRSSFAMIGRKGAKPGSVPQVWVSFLLFFNARYGIIEGNMYRTDTKIFKYTGRAVLGAFKTTVLFLYYYDINERCQTVHFFFL